MVARRLTFQPNHRKESDHDEEEGQEGRQDPEVLTVGKVTVNNFSGLSQEQFESLTRLITQLQGTQSMNFAQIQAELVALTQQNEKARAEIVDRLAALEAAVAAAGQSTPEVDAALAALRASIQQDDDMTPDAPAGDGTPVGG